MILSTNRFSTTLRTFPSQGVQKLALEGNSIELSTAAPNTEYAIQLNDTGAPAPPPYVHGSLIVRNNRIRYVDGGSGNGNGIKVYSAQNFLVSENVVDVSQTNPLRNNRCGSVKYFDNRTPAGILIRGINEANNVLYSELETDAEDAFVLAMFKKR